MKRILCIGGSGQLGTKIISVIAQHHLVNIDYRPHSQAKLNIELNKDLSSLENNQKVLQKVAQLGLRFNAILVTAGGWVQGSIKDQDYLTKLKKMNEVNLYPSMLGAHLATKYLEPNGLVVLTGAASVFKEPQPEMIAYAISKTGVHSLAMNLAQQASKFEGRVITILPETIDTATNREGMPTADFSKWSKPEQIGELLSGWISGLNVPNNGSFVVLGCKNGCITTEFV